MAIKTFKIKFFKITTTNKSNIYHSHLPLGKKGKSTGVLLRSHQLLFEKKKTQRFYIFLYTGIYCHRGKQHKIKVLCFTYFFFGEKKTQYK